MSEAVAPIDFVVLALWLIGVTVWGSWLGRGARGGKDYFLGGRNLPWWAVLLSVVATETSTLTFLSIPGVSYLGALTFMQLTLGYLVGRVVVAAFFLPAYARGEISTVYQLLETRFGSGVRRVTSGIFMITRLLADSVRLFATAIPLALITGWSYPVSIAVIGGLTLVYTWAGGIRAVVWVDAVQMGLYLGGALIAAFALQSVVPGGWGAILQEAGAAGKLALVDTRFDPGVAYTLWAGVLGGALFTMASHGTDHLIVQRLLTCRSLRDSRRALVGSGVLVIGQFLVFLLLGLGLWVHFEGRTFASNDAIFATFIVETLPPGVTGLLVAGVFAAAMSSLSSSINALASATVYDFWAPAVGAVDDDEGTLRAGRIFTLVWAALLIGGAILFIPFGMGTTAVEVALAAASLVYGGLLGVFLLALFSPRADGRSATLGIAAGVGVVAAVWIAGRVDVLPFALAWTWFVPVGGAVTWIVGTLFGTGAPARIRAHGPATGTAHAVDPGQTVDRVDAAGSGR
ncbi:MAG: sodium:solute symporter [Longimicrobiales bacterium]|nr:sodium:solute symporter [Longimicrobiales bacterium]